MLQEKLEGTFALAVISKDEPNKIFLTKNTGTMIVGVHDDFLIACSEPEVFQNFTDKYFVVGDNQLIEVDIDNISTELKKHELKKAERQEIRTKPKAGYSHFLEQEIYEQVESLARATNYGARLEGKGKGRVRMGGLDHSKETLLGIENLIIAACGTSAYAGLYGAYLFKKLHSFNTA